MSRILVDLRYAIRSLAKARGFSTAALLTLGLGIGLNAAIFSVVYGILLRPLDLPHPERLYSVFQDMEARGGSSEAWTGRGLFTDWRSRSRSFESMGAFITFPADLTGSDRPENVPAAVVSHELFSVLGVEPVIGRPFLPSEERQGEHRVAILSHGLFQRRFGGDSSILGETITINDSAYTVVGILPEGFRAPLIPRTEIWAPLPLDPPPDDRGYSYVQVIGRLKSGVSMAAAQEEMDRVAEILAAEYPEALEGVGVTLQPLLDSIVGPTRTWLWMLFGAVSLVLLAAAVNVANLMLTRTSARRQEMAIRTALGADRGRLIGQIFSESLVLAVAGSALGLLAGQVCLAILRGTAPAGTPRLDSIRLDGAVFAYTLAASLAAGLFAALFPALRLWRRPSSRAWRLAPGSTEGGPSHRLRGLLIGAQIALGVVLLVGAGLLVRTLLNLSQVDLGFRTDGLVLGRLTLPPPRFPQLHDMANFLAEVEQRLNQRGEIVAAGIVSNLPLADGPSTLRFAIERPGSDPGERHDALYRGASPGFFPTVEVPLLAGRLIETTDTAEALPVALINRELARRHFPDRDPLGQHLHLGEEDDPAEPWRTVVGVVGDVRGLGIDQPPAPEIYVPLAQRPSRIVTMIAGAAATPTATLDALREVPTEVHANQVAAKLETMEGVLSRELSLRRFTTRLLGIFASVVLVLLAVGVFGVTSLAVVQRRREIAIRLALGARRQSVVSMVLRWSALLIGGGLVVGLTAAYFAGRALDALLYGVDPVDAVTTATVVALLAFVGCAATLLPVLRAARTDPATALREI